MTVPCRIAWAALFLAAVVGCGQTEAKKRIVFLNNTNSPFWDACRAGMVEAEKELKLGDAGLTTVMEVNDDTTGGQINFLRQFGTQRDIVGVAISPVVADNPAIAAELKKLREKGIHVICVDNDLAESYRDAREYYIGTDNVKGGRQLAICARRCDQKACSTCSLWAAPASECHRADGRFQRRHRRKV